MFLEALVVVLEVVWVVLTILVEEETSVVTMALVAAVVVGDMAGERIAVMGLIMMVVMEEVTLVTLEKEGAMEVVKLW